MNTISFEITPSRDTNDDEVRIIIDGSYWFADGSMGMDPPALFAELQKKPVGQLMIGRCGCGVVGCGDVFVQLSRDKRQVIWETENKKIFKFDNENYNSAVERLLADNSWESTDRRVERLVSELMERTETEDGFSFQWASTRIQDNVVHLSYGNGPHQRLLEFSWNGKTEESALRRARQFKRERFHY